MACGRASDQLFCLSDKREARSTYLCSFPECIQTRARARIGMRPAFELFHLSRRVNICVTNARALSRLVVKSYGAGEEMNRLGIVRDGCFVLLKRFICRLLCENVFLRCCGVNG